MSRLGRLAAQKPTINECERNGCSELVTKLLVFDNAIDYWFCETHAQEWTQSVDVTLVTVVGAV